MSTDISMAFVIAILIELFSLISKRFKRFIIFVWCIIIIHTYFANGCQINFIGEMDLAVWMVFVIMFNEMVMFATEISMKYIK